MAANISQDNRTFKGEAGRFTIDASITLIASVLQVILGVGIMVIIARTLGPFLQGVYALAILLPSILSSFGNLGIGQASIFFIGKKKYLAKEIFTTNIILAFFLGILGFLIGLVIVLFYGETLFPHVDKAYLMLGLFLVPIQICFSFLNRFLLGLRKIKEFNIASVLQLFSFLILVGIFLLWCKWGVKAAISAYIISSAIGIGVSLYMSKKEIAPLRLIFNLAYFKDAFIYGFKIYVGNFLGLLRYKIDIFLVNAFLNPLAVGIYSIAVDISEKIWLISQSAGLVLFPKVSSETDPAKIKSFTPLVCRHVLLLTLTGAIVLLVLSRFLILVFYSDKFIDSIVPFRILLIGAVTMSGSKVLSNDLYGQGRPELNIYINIATIIINILLIVLLIPRYGIIGAAWSTTIAYSAAFLIMTVVYSKISGNRILDVILPKKSDFKIYKNLLFNLLRK